MTATEAETWKVALGRLGKSWIRFDWVMLLSLCALNFYILLSAVPAFQQIYAQALPGKPLSGTTIFLITHRNALSLALWTWPVMGLLLWKWQNRYAVLWINLGIIWTILELAVTVVALFIQIVGGLSSGVPDTSDNTQRLNIIVNPYSLLRR